MHNAQWLTFIAVFLLASCVSRQERDDMQARLAQMAQWNTDDTVFTARHTAEAQTLADWFDSHGTSNEQLRAHYILGRTYADRGETPRAVDSYLDAIAKADTTAADCDYATLGRVYTQMSDLYHQQLLFSNEVLARQQARHSFLCAKDTFYAIYHQGMISGTYILMNKQDSAEILLRETISQYNLAGYEQDALQFSTSLMHIYIDQHCRLSELKQLIDQYDQNSKQFDEHHNLPPSQRIFYYYKGRYYEEINRLDSAEYYYRKIYRPNMSYTAKNPLYKGLLSVFKKHHQPDSIAKYTQLYCEANDSSIAIKDQQLTAQLVASYKYNSIQKEAQKNAENTYYANLRSVCLLVVLIMVVTIVTVIFRKYRRNRKKMETLYNKAIVERSKLREELNSLKTKDYDAVIAQKEHEIERLSQTIIIHEEARRQTMASNDMAQFENSDIVHLFSEKKLFRKGDDSLTGSDWKQLTNEFRKDMPAAFSVMTDSRLSELQLQVCILLLLDYEESIIAALKETKPQTINNAKIRANKKMFMVDNASTLKTNLRRLIAT
jgi:tetratricopeptide (TPR) repeat protein